MKISLIAAMAANRVIGRDNRLPWRLPADLRRFKALTMGHTLLLGRRTFESIGRPLPGRSMLVVTRQEGYAPEGVRVVHSVEEALALAREAGESELFVAGGSQIYRQTLPAADRLHLTRIEEDFPGDVYFPEYDESQWMLVDREDHGPNEPNEDVPFAWSFQVWDRRQQTA
ncbi:MAG TPA: dihydrofolate reductase [Thermoanaerobaculia bacterium]|nr:dihydrofolate reductase [Thermoanaerobaculia bacterium]